EPETSLFNYVGKHENPKKGFKIFKRVTGEYASASTPSETATGSAGRSTTWSQSRQLSAKEPVPTTCQMEEPSHPVFETGADNQPIVQTSQHPEWFSQPKRPPSSDRDWNQTLPATQGDAQSWIRILARQTDARSSFNELLNTPIDFSNFIMNQLNVDTLTPALLAGPTYELMRGSCNSLTELEYHLEEVYKATTDQLDWVNPEGQQYPHNLLKPLPLIPDNQGRRVIPFDHFINNDLEYLRGGASSRKYTTSVTKTKAADCGHIKWIEDLVPRAMWIQEPINYDRHALWGVSYWRQKRQQFYGFAVNRESALDVYSKRRIIAVTELKIVEWHNYKHLDWISVRHDDDKIYKFKEGNFKRLRLQDIEDMLLLLEHCHPEARGRSSTGYQNKDKKNRLMRIDELHKFSDGKLNDVRNALDDYRGSKRLRERGEHASASTPSETATRSAGRSTTGSQSRQLSASADDQPIVQTSQHPEWFFQPKRPPSSDRDWNKTLPAAQGDAQSWISVLARQTNARSSFNELLDTPIDFSNFIINRLNVDTLTPALLAGPTYELMRGSCNSLTELEYHLEEVYKATTDQLDWVNPEDYGHIKWIEDLVPRAMWIQEPINYDRHALWGVSHWGRKRQQFYGFAVNRESALDVYSKRRIIVVTELKIVEWHNYKHLDWISMDVKTDFLYEKIQEEVYVYQPSGFEDPDFPDKVFHKGKIDKTLFVRRHKGDILLVQVYVDDIIFGSTKKELCNAFEKMMYEKFQMSSIGELTFFLGLQVKQKQDGIFISQDKYVAEIVKKYEVLEIKNASSTIDTQKPLLKDEYGEKVDVHMYRSMIGSLLYLTSSRLDIMFAVCACARYQVNPKVSHPHAVKRIFRLISWQCKKQTMIANSTTKAKYVAASSCREQATIKAKTITREVQKALVDGKKVIIAESTVRRDLQLEDFEDEAVNKEMDDSLVRAATTTSSLEAELDSGNINKTQSQATLNELSSIGTSSGVYTPRSDEDSLKLKELMELCTNLQNKVLDLENTKTTLALEIDSLKRKVKKLEKKQRSITHKLKRLYKVGLTARVDSSNEASLEVPLLKEVNAVTSTTTTATIDDITLAKALMEIKSTKPKAYKVVIQEPEQGITTTTLTTTITSASIRPKAKGLVIHEQEQAPTLTFSSQQPSQVKVWDKGKDKMVEPEPVKKLSKKDQLMLDEELAFKKKKKGLLEKKLNKLKKSI
nr:hypothetical protein [Tanacetum cinerariifolium]